MPYNSSTSAYERRAATVIDATPDGDTVAVAIDVKLDQGIDDYVTDLNHHDANGNHYPATSVGSDSRFLKQSPAGVVSWADGVVAADAALKDMSNVASGTITSAQLVSVAPAKITQDASNRFVTDTEKSTWNGALYDKADVESVLTGTITTHTHTIASASESAAGLVELNTTAEAATGEDTSRAVTAAGLDAYHKANNINLGVSYTIVGNETHIDFGSDEEPIPSGVKRCSIKVTDLSSSSTSSIIIRLGTSPSNIKTSGYVCTAGGYWSGSTRVTHQTDGFHWLDNLLTYAASFLTGAVVLEKFKDDSNIWFIYGTAGAYNGSVVPASTVSGHVDLGGTLGTVSITTVNGTDVFDAGTINIAWEF